MASTVSESAFDGKALDLHALRRQRSGSDRVPFTDVDMFEGVPSEPLTLHKYAYTHNDPVNGTDPTGKWTLSQVTVATGIGISLIGGALWFAGSHFNNPTLAGVGQNITVFGASVALAGVGFMIAPAVGFTVLATEIPLFIANLTYTWGSSGAVNRAKNVVVSKSVPGFLSDYYYYGMQQKGQLPPSGRIVVRGTGRFGYIPYSSRAEFGSAAVPLVGGDYIYDCGLVGDGSSGEMAVAVASILPDGRKQDEGQYRFSSGTLNSLQFAKPANAPPPEILVNK
jgi:hypothetical protein